MYIQPHDIPTHRVLMLSLGKIKAELVGVVWVDFVTTAEICVKGIWSYSAERAWILHLHVHVCECKTTKEL